MRLTDGKIYCPDPFVCLTFGKSVTENYGIQRVMVSLRPGWLGRGRDNFCPEASERSKLGIEGTILKRVSFNPAARTIGEVRQEVRP